MHLRSVNLTDTGSVFSNYSSNSGYSAIYIYKHARVTFINT